MIQRLKSLVRLWLMPSVARYLWCWVAAVSVYSFLIALLDQFTNHQILGFHFQFYGLFGTVLGIMLVFRTNTAYDRWWEGRRLWGQLVNDVRNLCIKVRALSKLDQDGVLHFGRLLISFARALKEHLRGGVRPRELSLYRTLKVAPSHVPSHVAFLLR